MENTQPPENPLLQLQEWLKEQSKSLNFSIGKTCDSVPYLNVWTEEDSNAELRFLPFFRLIGSHIKESIFDLCLLSYQGNEIEHCQVNVGDRSLNDGSVEIFVKQFYDNEFKFCSGFDDDAKIGRPPVDQILIELLNGRIITRSRNCRFKVDLPNSKICSVCKLTQESFAFAYHSGEGAMDNNGGFLHVQIKSEPISNNYDYQEEEEEEDDESEFPENLVYVKIEEAKFAANEPRNPRQTLKRNRSKQKKKFSKVRIVEGESDYDDEDEDYVRIKHEIGEGEDEDGAPEVRSANKNYEEEDWNEEGISNNEDCEMPMLLKKKKRNRYKKCGLCGIVFQQNDLFRIHLNENPDCKTIFQARNKKKREEEKLRKQRREAAKNSPEEFIDEKSNFRKKCTICLDVYTIEKNYLYDQDAHEKILQDLDSPVKCPNCDKLIPQRRLLNLHFEEAHTKNTGDRKSDKGMCCICLSVMKRRSVKFHQKLQHEIKTDGKMFLCTICGKQPKSKQLLELHLARKHNLARDGISPATSQVCDQCGKTYISIDLLKQHIAVMHKMKARFECEDCKKNFLRKSALVAHTVCTHLKFRPFKCNVCQKYAAGDLSGVYRHCQRSHGRRGTMSDVIIDQNQLQEIRELFNYNYYGTVT